MNAAVGKEREYEIKPVEKKKRVLIVGGGLAGMEAARVAALRGHDVTLCDKAPKLGGLVPVAAIVKERELEALVDIMRYYENQLTKLGVTLKLGVTADIDNDTEVQTGRGDPGNGRVNRRAEHTGNR